MALRWEYINLVEMKLNALKEAIKSRALGDLAGSPKSYGAIRGTTSPRTRQHQPDT